MGLVDQASQLYERGSVANKPTDEELSTTVPGLGGKTYRDIGNDIAKREVDLTQQRHAKLAEAVVPGDPTSPNWLQVQELAQRAPAFQDGEIAFIAKSLSTQADDMDTEEATSRIKRIKAKYPKLTEAQAADIALQTQDKFNFWILNPAESPEATALARSYEELNKMGGAQGVSERIATVTSKFDAELAKLPVAARQLSGSARLRGELPPLVSNIYTGFKEAEAERLEQQAKAEREKAEAEKRRAAEVQKVIERANAFDAFP